MFVSKCVLNAKFNLYRDTAKAQCSARLSKLRKSRTRLVLVTMTHRWKKFFQESQSL